ncbi:MAG: glycoside hydrolase family 5 protein [Butyribacter sp.]|nr:glycoside hydrolase family 5 protein [bacterium]MDY3854097.1 glycoside hydrolase family 5 protein [Butyribacter sp.]
MKRGRLKRITSFLLSTALIGSTIVTGTAVNAEESANLITNQSVTGSATYVGTYLKSDYYSAGYTGLEISFTYTDLGTLASDNTTGFNDTFEFLVFDSAWGGWNCTKVGPAGYDQTENLTASDVSEDTEYTVTVPIDTIEDKLSTSNPVQGINLQTGGIGNTAVTINSLKYVTGTVESQPTVLTGAWHKTGVDGDTEEQYGTMNLTSGFANVYANPWNISVSNFSVSTFTTPVVAVTVEYADVTGDPIYPQSEILDSTTYQPIVANYPQVSEGGTVTYVTQIPTTMTSMLLAYDTCTVKKVEIYDEAESYTTAKTNLSTTNITAAVSPCWNLGNALESTSNGETGETLWGNPTINKRLFKQVAAVGFKSVRIPVTWLSAVTVNGSTGTVNTQECDAILDRVKEVVDMAIDYDLFVIIDVHHDGGENVTGKWLDITASNQTGIQNAFEALWTRIAQRFRSYDQHLIFESMNEVMESNNYSTNVSDEIWTNINDLNQIFVEAVRGAGGSNTNRFLMVPGYNTNIDSTVSAGFRLPDDTVSNRLMVSVHFYDPYNFTLNTGDGSTTSITEAESAYIGTQFAKLKTTFVDEGIPVILDEFGAVDKDNLDAIAAYTTEVVSQAQAKGIGYGYWDNGYTGDYGMGLWNRYTYGQTALGERLLPILAGNTAE